MITRQTTSNILLTQMIGRALRGEKAGGGVGKDYANIVFFHDLWKRLDLPWATIDGGTDDTKPIKQSRDPMSLVSIQLIKLATADIEFVGFENAPYRTFIPVGFLSCEYTVAIEDSQEMISFAESVIVYDFNKRNYDNFLNHVSIQDLTQYASESLPDNALEDISKKYATQFFDVRKDFDGLLIDNISKIIRHVAQNDEKPVFLDFHERDLYDMDKLADDLLNTSPIDADIQLTNKFNDGSLWQFLYKSYDNFMDAYYKSQKRVFAKRRGQSIPPEIKPVDTKEAELTDKIREQVFDRDNFTCLCCGKERRTGVPLNADHILPVASGGKSVISNLQTLCKRCNEVKGTNEIDYRAIKSPLRKPKDKLNLFDFVQSDDVENIVARIVNDFYHCKAQRELNYHEGGRGKYYSKWEIILFEGNDPKWIKPHIPELRSYVRNLGWRHISNIIVKN